MSIAASPARRRSSHVATFFVLVVVVGAGVAAITLFGTSNRLPAALDAIVSRLRAPATASHGNVGVANAPTAAAPAGGDLREVAPSETPSGLGAKDVNASGNSAANTDVPTKVTPVAFPVKQAAANWVDSPQDVEPTPAKSPSGQAATAAAQAAPTAMPQAIPAPAPPAATSQSLDPFLLSATRPAAQALGPVATTAAPARPTAVQTVQAAPPASEPADSMGAKARLGFPTGQLPPLPGSQGSQPTLPAMPFGLRLADVSRDEALLRMGLLTVGALVTEVVPGGDGAQAGLQPGDRLVRVASQPVVSAAHFAFVASQQRSGSVEIEVIRGGTLYRSVLGSGALAGGFR